MPKTKRSYEGLLKTHVYPTLGPTRLSSLTSLAAQGLFNALAKGALSSRTVQYIHAVLEQGLKHCVRHGLIAKNHAEFITLPRLERSEPQILSPEQCGRLLESSQEPWRTLWMVSLGTGMRPQEYLALTWADLSKTEQGGTLDLTKALREITPGQYAAGDMKTKSSRRAVSIGPDLYDALVSHQRQTRAIAGPIFRSNRGTALDITRVRKQWYRDLETADLPKVKLYAGRHTHLSMLLSSGVNPRAVADRAGHSTVKMTLDRYAKAMPKEQHEIASQTDALLFARKVVAV